MTRVLIAVVMLQLGCGRATHENPGPAELNIQEKLTPFSTVQSQVLNQHCVSCHQSSRNPIDLTSRQAILRRPGLVKPGAPEESKIYLVVRDGQMPPTGPLTDNSAALIYDWILGLESDPLQR